MKYYFHAIYIYLVFLLINCTVAVLSGFFMSSAGFAFSPQQFSTNYKIHLTNDCLVIHRSFVNANKTLDSLFLLEKKTYNFTNDCVFFPQSIYNIIKESHFNSNTTPK